ncbi:S-layer homology domain-containing protein [Intestinimonas sp. MSJ-38]|uniref:S-layer homology domain-containing protein n=1 Tax=Intestinimonas sp. MSJ-38 TaxID=2841532 RepID=UPI001C113D51|nr:S-layer homology domain-containing protein [Intestinimonas sp. MSJ-38]MBU5431420.1 S-layer homology domain-containing protein [Intestinimonas sp. MSJ-38]
MKKRLLSWLLVLTMVISLVPSTLVTTAFAANAAGGGVVITGAQSLGDDANPVTTASVYKISGTRQNPVKITATDKVVLVLDGVTIATATSPIELADGAKVILVVKDNTTNVLTCTATNLTADNSGKTAGILVPESASLIIDRVSGETGTGTLSVTGGYGGAGIGGAATLGYTSERGAKGADGDNGSAGAWDVADIKGQAGTKGTGGQGGLYGQSATNAGAITINAGTVNAVGGQGGAGIGGGRGGDGQNGEVGTNGSSGTEGQAVRRWNTGTYRNQRTDCGASGSAGGGGAGGNGGNGGAGGNGGVVAIKGGTVTAEGKNGAAGIGGGAGGNGGNGGSGGSGGAKVGNQNTTVANHFGWGDVYWYPGFGGAGGNGEGGHGGTGGTGGAGGTLSITGGKVQSNGYTGFGGGSVGTAGTKGNGTRTNGESSTYAYFWYAKGGSNSWSNQYYGHWYGNNAEAYYSQAAGPGGNGGAAGTQAAANANGADGTLTITGSSNNVDFMSNGSGNLTNGQPTDKNNNPLYRVELTVFDLEKDSKIKDANVNVEVPGGGSKVAYTYKTVSEENGKAVLWLPVGEYTLTQKAVNHATLGAIPKDRPVTFTVAENNGNKQDVMIGVSVKVTADKTDKVYFTKDTEYPVKIQVDTSDMDEVDQPIQSIKWFRETIKDHEDTEYGPTDTGNKGEFDERYGQITDGNKGTLTVATEKVYSLSINQNGRYWVQIEYKSNGMNAKLVKGLTVNNIYRTFDIQFRTEWWETVGGAGGTQKLIKSKPEGDGVYGPLLDSQGNPGPQKVGFAWDLDGYNAADISAGTLLADPYGGFDQVKFYAVSSELSYNTAVLGNYHGFTQTNLHYDKTMDGSFFTANEDCDMVRGVKDYGKYTLKYSPKDANLTLVTIYGRVQDEHGAVDPDAEPLYTSQRAYTPLITEDNIKASAWTGYKLVGVRVNGQPTAFVKDDQGNDTDVVALTEIHGSMTKDKIRTVEFLYEYNMTNVTIHGYLKGTTDKVFDDITVPAEIGTRFNYPQPDIAGYDTESAVPANGIIDAVAKNDTIIFYYLKSKGNVTYKAVDADGGVLATKTETINNGGTVVKTTDKANDLFTIPYYTLTGAGTASADTYNGKDDVTVTYTYTRNKHKLTVVKKDVDSKQAITGAAQEITNVPAGKTYTFGATEITAVAGYTAATELNPTSYTMGDADAEVIFWYKKNDDQRYATVTVNCEYDGQVFHSYTLPAVKDVTLPIPAPTLDGYKIKTGTDATKNVTPNGNPDNDTVTFQYELDGTQKTVTVKLVGKATVGGTESELTKPSGYQVEYLLKKGESVTIQAPHIDGYDPVSADLTSSATQPGDKQRVTVSWGGLTGNATLTFHYEPKSSTSFVTHTIKFTVMKQGANHEVYSYSKLIPRGTGAGKKVEYKEDDVKYTLPGYAFTDISYEVGGHETYDPNQVTDLVDATIIYHFEEDAAQIVIKQNCTVEPDQHSKKVTLTGYRKGQTNIKVMAPLLDGHALAPGEPTFQTVGLAADGGLKAGANEVTFKYVGEKDLMFKLVEVELDESGAVTSQKTIQLIQAGINETYNPKTQGNALDLSDLGYTFAPCNLATDPFNSDTNPEITHSTTLAVSKTYTVCYTKKTRDVDFVAVDKSQLDAAGKTLDAVINDGTVDNYTIADLNPVIPEKARVGETYKAVAQSFNGWALRDDYSKYYEVADAADQNDHLKVYFMYVPKASGTVVIQYNSGTDDQNKGMPLNEYSFQAVAGEKVSITPPKYILNGKYKLRTGQDIAHLLSVEATHATEKTFYYEPNFVTVTVKTKTGDAQAELYATHEVNKTNGSGTPTTDSLTLTPPNKAGYTLVGITGAGDGTAATLPTGFNGSIQLTGWDADKEITYYYQKTTAAEYQYDLKVKYLHNNNPLAEEKIIKVSKDQENSIDVPTFGDYQAKTYQLNGSTPADVTGNTVTITPTADVDTLVIHYGRTDGTIVLPGKDNKILAPDDKDNVVVKPGTGTTITGPEADGSIKIPENGTGTVTRPIDPTNPDQGKEEVKVPGGTVIKPDGSIVLPTTPDGPGGTIAPGDKLPDAVPVGYRAVVYKANGGVGDDQINIYRNDETIRTIFNPFTNGTMTFTGWSTAENGVGGTNLDEDAEITGLTGNVTFYAQWAKKNNDGSIELPGKDNKIPAPDDKDNIIVTPGNGGTLDGPKKPDGSVEVKGDEGTVTRPIDPAKPDQGKENIKVPEGSIVYPDGTIKLPDGTTVKPEDKFPDAVVTEKYVVMTYEPNGGGGNVVRKVVEKNAETTTLPGTEFTAPSGKEFKSWLDVTTNAEVAENSAITPTKDMVLRAQWKDSTPIPTTYSAEITFESNHNDPAATQTLTGTTGEILTGKLNAYAFTPPTGWKFMGWSTAKAASQNAAFYANEATVTLKHGEKLTLYAILYKLDANTGVATLPGKDGQPEGGDDVTVKPPAGGTPPLVPGNGFITAPTGSGIKQPANANPIKVIEGEVNVYPDGSVFVPDGSKVTDKDGGEVTGPSIIKPDGSKDEDANKKPIQKPDGTIVLPGKDGTIGGGDDIIVKPNGGKPAGRIDETTGNVTITDPNGADVKFEGKTPENVKVPVGSIIEPDGTVTLAYTIRYVDGSGRDLHTPAILLLKENAIKTVKYVSIDGYTPKGDQTQTITGKLSENLSQYTITFTYDKLATGGNTGGGSSGGGGGSSGGGGGSSGGGGGSSGGSAGGTTNPTQPDTKPTPGTKPNDPTQTGIANWLRTDKHTTSMTGYGNGLFGPEDKVTRAQVAQIFYRLLKDNNVKITVNFTDVPDDAWYATAVNTLGSLGIVGGIGDGSFDPDRPITRAEFCVIATRFAKVISTVENPFSDINAQDWYYTAVTTAASYDWVTGMGDGSFRPYDVITRAQAATIINRMLGAAADRAYVDEHVTNPYRDVAPTHWAYYQIIEASVAHDHGYDAEGVEIWKSLK